MTRTDSIRNSEYIHFRYVLNIRLQDVTISCPLLCTVSKDFESLMSLSSHRKMISNRSNQDNTQRVRRQDEDELPDKTERSRNIRSTRDPDIHTVAVLLHKLAIARSDVHFPCRRFETLERILSTRVRPHSVVERREVSLAKTRLFSCSCCYHLRNMSREIRTEDVPRTCTCV